MSGHPDLELSAYLDGDLAGDDLARLEAHLAGCEACRATLDDLRRLVRRAGALDERPPERDLWAGIAARIATERTAAVVPLATRRRFAFTAPQLAAAAVALMAVSAGAGMLLRQASPAPTAAVTPAFGAPARVVNLPSQRAVDSYDAAIAELEGALAADRGRMDSATVAILERSLGAIDSAIAQARAALARYPDNLYLNGTLQRALDSKLEVLRRVATLTVAS